MPRVAADSLGVAGGGRAARCTEGSSSGAQRLTAPTAGRAAQHESVMQDRVRVLRVDTGQPRVHVVHAVQPVPKRTIFRLLRERIRDFDPLALIEHGDLMLAAPTPTLFHCAILIDHNRRRQRIRP